MSIRTGVIKDIDLVAAGNPILLDVGRVGQKGRDYWCWASSVAMVLRYIWPSFQSWDVTVLLCWVAQKSKYTSLGNCCVYDPCHCDNVLYAHEITTLWERIKFPVDSEPLYKVKPDYRDIQHRPSIDRLLQEIRDNKLPIEVGFNNIRSGHVVILYGFEEIEGTMYFYYHDSAPPAPSDPTRMSEDNLLASWNGERWEDTWLNLGRTPI